MSDQDSAHYAELLRLLAEVDGWLARIDPDDPRPRPAPGSPLYADDERADPYQLSHAAWHSLSHAIDHLGCLNAVLKDARVIHMYAPFTLVRAALENASAAVWMLQPNSRPERLARRLRFAVTDIRNGEQAKRLVGKVGPRSEHERMEQIRDIARRGGIDEAEAVHLAGYAEIVKAASSGSETEVVPLIWKLCSGMTHGDYWTTFSATERVELPGAPPGVGAFKITANVKLLMYATTMATGMTRRGWQLYDQRSQPPF